MRQQLALGTAQFGLDYGITNTHGRVGSESVRALLDAAWDGGVRCLDTAPAYGGSEAALGGAFAARPGRNWRIVTKTRPLRLDALVAGDVADVGASFAQSLRDLRTDAVDTLLVHHADDVLVPGGERLFAWLLEQRASGRARRIGVSVYESAQIADLLQRYRLDVVQLPASIADQRLVQDGSLGRLAAAGVEIHARSLYLQGLLLAQPQFVAARFPAQLGWFEGFRAACRDRGVSPTEACLSFLRANPVLSVGVLGAASASELADTLAAWEASTPMDWSAWAVDNPAFTDPRQWQST